MYIRTYTHPFPGHPSFAIPHSPSCRLPCAGYPSSPIPPRNYIPLPRVLHQSSAPEYKILISTKKQNMYIPRNPPMHSRTYLTKPQISLQKYSHATPLLIRRRRWRGCCFRYAVLDGRQVPVRRDVERGVAGEKVHGFEVDCVDFYRP